MPNPSLAELGLTQDLSAQHMSQIASSQLVAVNLDQVLVSVGKAIMIYGASGIGKTTLSFTLPPREGGIRWVIDTEGGLSVVKNAINTKVFAIQNYAQIIQLRAEMKNIFKLGDVVIADSITEWLRINTIAALEFPAKRNYNEVPVLQDWGLIIERMRDTLRDLRNLRRLGVDVIFVCGERYDKDENLGQFVGGPSLAGQLASESTYLVDEVYHMVSVASPQGERRMFHTVPHQFWNAKTRNGLPPTVDCVKGDLTLAKYFRA